MKYLISLSFALFSINALTAQIPSVSGFTSKQSSDGTSLGANETISSGGISLSNVVKLRGYINFIVHRLDDGSDTFDEDLTYSSGDLDFLFDFSPVTAEIHLGAEYGFEQVFGRYSATNDFHVTFGRQVTFLGYQNDEWTERNAVTNAYVGDAAKLDSSYNSKHYVDGIRLNYNNGMFGFVLGLLDHYGIHNDSDDLDDGMAIELVASVMIIPGLEARLGFANENDELSDDDSQQINAWVEWQPNDLTLVLEYDHYNFSDDFEAWDMMLMANYQFTDFLGLTLRYSHMEHEFTAGDLDSDRVTLAVLLSFTDNFDVNLEYSHTSNDSNTISDGKDDNELYLQGLIHF